MVLLSKMNSENRTLFCIREKVKVLTIKILTAMRRGSIMLLCLLAATLSCGALLAQETLKRKVAIGRFSNETTYSKSVFYDKENDPMGKQASDILSSRLASTDKFLLIERQDYDKIVKELNTSGAVSQAIGADFLIIGSITEFGRKTIGTQGFATQTKEQIVEAAVSIRLVDVATGLVVYSGEAKGEASTKDKSVLGFGKSADFDATLADKAISVSISKLVENIINKCMDSPWRAYILSVEEGTVVMSGGKSQGIKEGMVFNVYQRGKKVKNPQTGIMIELPGKVVAKFSVQQTIGSSIQDEISIGAFTEGTIDATKLDEYFIQNEL